MEALQSKINRECKTAGGEAASQFARPKKAFSSKSSLQGDLTANGSMKLATVRNATAELLAAS